MRTRRTASVTLVLLAVLTACGTRTGSPSDDRDGPGAAGEGGATRTGPPVTGVRWNVDSVTVGGKRAEVPDGAHFTIDTKGGAAGRLGCNQFRARAAVSGSTITFDAVETTKMACPTPRAKLEQALLSILDGRTTYRVDERTLTLASENDASLGATAREPGE
ncbi:MULTISPECIES: META domain-containing protein [unclassified Streptomyces]|uniref:META domain-containing protein n=1 Tax=unclassified Streptomyces TaxID=2593676 RepID=UPI0037023E9C